MSTSPITLGGSSSVQDLATQLAKTLDKDNNGTISTTEFGTFLQSFLTALLGNQKAGLSTSANGIATTALSALTSAASTAASTSAASIGAYRDDMLGFDLTRMQSAASSPKYAFANLAQSLAPTDANMRLIASELGTSVGHLDDQNNFMLDADGGGYIGVRDRGNGPEWQWMAYNTAHPGPNGEIT
jgi:hypothetical protein